MPIAENGYGYYARLWHLANGLADRGHKITLLGHPKSKIKGRLIKAAAKKIEWETQLGIYADFIKNYGNEFDLINAQTDHLCCYFAPFIKTPVLHTIIFGSFWSQVEEALKIFKDQNFSTLSEANKKHYPFLNWRGVVHNGLDLNKFEYNEKPDDYFLFLSRVNREKGAEEAIRLAKKTGIKLIIAGQAEKNYFETAIRPNLDGKITYFGIADFKQKIKLLKKAKALIHPHLYPEGFGNSMIEAQACGTPVIAYPFGSTSEVVNENKSGLIAKNFKELKGAVKNIEKINRSDCRRWIEENFTLKKMIDGYEELYLKIIKKK